MNGEAIEEEMERFAIWYNHDGVKRAADVRKMRQDGQVYYKCRLFNGSEIEIEQVSSDTQHSSWNILSGGITPLSIKLGKAIEENNL